MALLEIKDLSFTYGVGCVEALKNVELTVREGELVLLCGESGCGKTTLMRLIKSRLSPSGSMTGSITFCGDDIRSLDERRAACDIGYVMQNPETQIITDTCISELAFGLQSLGMTHELIDARIAEVAGFFGISHWYGRKTRDLSGGEKQLLSLASVMVMKPRLLLLDEPTSELDPVSARRFMESLKKLRDELGLTVIMSEHRLDEAFPLADKVVVMKKGSILAEAQPKTIGKMLYDGNNDCVGLPAPVRIYHLLGGGGCDCPITVREGRNYIFGGMKGKTPISAVAPPDLQGICENVISLREISFSYGKGMPFVLENLDLEIKKGELLCLLGGNGCGKTTLLKLICGLLRPLYGRYSLFGKRTDGKKNKGVSYLPQNYLTVFTADTVKRCFENIACSLGLDKKTSEERYSNIAKTLGIAELSDRHPYDLSGGEGQRAAIGMALFTEPEILLLDEPTKGQDAASKARLADVLLSLKKSGKTLVISTHDLEFAAEYADRCALVFGGRIASLCAANEFFAQNDYYTTSAARMTRPLFENAVTVADAVKCCTSSGFSYE